ncbi:hypothetical protein [Amycolatopsis sp. NPDC049159]|uniref:hypothetical protein n=1 Tax=Amycolatopsis sp. NPDC049159 TaxID=3157210 RepID=UPI0033E447B7
MNHDPADGEYEEIARILGLSSGTANVIRGPVSGTVVQAGTIGSLHVHHEGLTRPRQSDHLAMCVARVLSRVDEPAGVAMVVDRRTLVTDIEVVSRVLGADATPGGSITVDFPLLAPGRTHTAVVERWRPDGLDIAVLRLTSAPTQRLLRVWLVDPGNCWGHRAGLVAIGLGAPDGVPVNAVLLAHQDENTIAIDIQAPARPDLLGSPVWDDDAAGIVGVAVRGSRVLSGRRIAAAVGLDLGPVIALAPPDDARARRALRLGFAHVLSARLEALPAGEDRDRQVDALLQESADHADFLGVDLPQSAPDPDPRVGVLLGRIRDGHAVRNRLARTHGPGVAAAHWVGVRLAAVSEKLAPVDDRARDADGIATGCRTSGLPDDLAQRTADLVRQPSAAAADLSDVWRCRDELVGWWDERLATDRWTRAAQRDLWGYTRSAAFAGIARARGVDTRFAATARRHADALDIDVPALFDRTGDTVTDDVRALHYILEEIPAPITRAMVARYGPTADRILSLSRRLFGWLLYPEPELCRDLATTITDTCHALRLPNTLGAPHSSSLAGDADYDTASSAILAFDRELRTFLDQAVRTWA